MRALHFALRAGTWPALVVSVTSAQHSIPARGFTSTRDRRDDKVVLAAGVASWRIKAGFHWGVDRQASNFSVAAAVRRGLCRTSTGQSNAELCKHPRGREGGRGGQA